MSSLNRTWQKYAYKPVNLPQKQKPPKYLCMMYSICFRRAIQLSEIFLILNEEASTSTYMYNIYAMSNMSKYIYMFNMFDMLIMLFYMYNMLFCMFYMFVYMFCMFFYMFYMFFCMVQHV